MRFVFRRRASQFGHGITAHHPQKKKKKKIYVLGMSQYPWNGMDVMQWVFVWCSLFW
jgi:hypothetical protein